MTFAPIPDDLYPGPERGEEFKHRLGYRPLDLADWFVIDTDYERMLEGKRQLLADRFDDVFRAELGAEAGSGEVLAAIVDNLKTHHPASLDDVRHELDALRHPLDIAGRLVQDDLALLDMVDGRLRFVAGSICSPNRWKLAVKIGNDLDAIHRPVPGYQAQVANVVESSLQRLTVDRPVWRANWGMTDRPDLYQPAALSIGAPITTPERAATNVWLRIERQTLRRFPQTGVVLFAIRTFQCRLGDLATRPSDAARLLAAVEQLPGDVAGYKSISRPRAAVVSWLRRCSDLD
jgi:hypothetical protein